MDFFEIMLQQKLAGGNGNEPVIEALSVTENGTYTPPSGTDGYSPIIVNVSGGGGGMSLLAEKSLGNVSVTSTSETSVGSVSFTDEVGHDMYLAVITRNEIQNNYHYATVSMLYFYGANDRESEGPGFAGYSITNRWNCMVTQSGKFKTAQSGRGLYIAALSKQETEISLTIAGIYNSTGTQTINGEYSVQIYGINLYELIS